MGVGGVPNRYYMSFMLFVVQSLNKEVLSLVLKLLVLISSLIFGSLTFCRTV